MSELKSYTDENGIYYQELHKEYVSAHNHEVTFYGIDVEAENRIFSYVMTSTNDGSHEFYTLEEYSEKYNYSTDVLDEVFNQFKVDAVDARRDYLLDGLPLLMTPREITFNGDTWSATDSIPTQADGFFDFTSLTAACTYRHVDFTQLPLLPDDELQEVLADLNMHSKSVPEPLMHLNKPLTPCWNENSNAFASVGLENISDIAERLAPGYKLLAVRRDSDTDVQVRLENISSGNRLEVPLSKTEGNWAWGDFEKIKVDSSPKQEFKLLNFPELKASVDAHCKKIIASSSEGRRSADIMRVHYTVRADTRANQDYEKKEVQVQVHQVPITQERRNRL